MMSRMRGKMMSGKTWMLGACFVALMLVLGGCAQATGDSTGVSARQTGDELSGERSDSFKERLKDKVERPGAGYEPCAGKVCGDYCTICDPNDPDCYETMVVKYCGADGSCSPTPTACTEIPGNPGEYDPCEGKTCGERCQLCDPNDPDCVETAVLKQCNARGVCSAARPICKEPPVEYEPCAGKVCGDYCTICDPNDPDCYETMEVKYCGADGSCTPTPTACTAVPGNPGEYEPCAGKVCGERCTVCDPSDRDCYETAVVKFCSSDGTCSPFATCAE